MIDVWFSNQIERLAGRLIEHLSAAALYPAARLFSLPPVVVPNPQIATYLKYEIARGAGIAAALSFHVPESFLRSLLQASRPAWRLLDRGVLRALFLEVLDDAAAAHERLPGPVRAYLDAAGDDGGARDLRRFQLANRLARLAAQYGQNRPDLLRAWSDNQPVLGAGALAETESWQRDLWSRLVAPGGPLARAQAAAGARWILPLELFDVLKETQGDRAPREVHIFGFSYMWAGFRELLEHLNQVSDVHVYSPSPCAAFADADLALVKEWGRPGKEFADMLATLRGVTLHGDFVTETPPTALGRLQGEILRGAADADAADPPAVAGSFTVLECPGIRREAETIAGEIWRLLRDDEHENPGSPRRLRFRDIAVLLADPLAKPAYQAHLRAAFEGLYNIPYNMIDLPLAGECRAVEAVLLLLALPLGEFTRPEVLPLLTHPAVRAKFPGADAGRWRTWCEQLEIVRGADRLDLADTYLDGDLFHWEQGLRRLVLGAFMTGPRCGDERGYSLEGCDLLPHDEPVGAQADAARLLLLVRSLVADARFARSAKLTLADWSMFLARMVNAYLAADTDIEQRALALCLGEIHKLAELGEAGGSVGYRIACECVRDALKDLAGARGYYLADGVAVASLLQMRALPFRVAFICGLGEGRFPAADGPDPLDLSLAGRRAGDVSNRERDKYLFLETLASTRERLYVSYVARDAQTGEALEPSPIVHELLHRLDHGSPGTCWIQKQPLRRFEVNKNPVVPIAGFAARREARAQELRTEFLKHCGAGARMTSETIWRLRGDFRAWLGLCPPAVPAGATRHRPLQVSLRDLRRFLECPLQGWARVMLRLREDDDDDSANREDEPFVTERLPGTILLRGVFAEALGQGLTGDSPKDIEDLYTPRAAALARAGKMPAGLFRQSDRRRHLDSLRAWCQGVSERGLLKQRPFHIHRFGRAAEYEPAERLAAGIPLEVPLPAGNGAPTTVRVELFGRTEMVSRTLPGSLTPVNRAKPCDKDFLAGFFDALALCLDPDHRHAAVYEAHVVATDRKPEGMSRAFRGIDADSARRFLTELLAELLGQPHAYLLPCEAVFARLTEDTPVAVTVDKILDSDKAACSSRYGPVPNFDLYDPPGEDDADAMINRRFGLFRDSGGIVA